MLRLRRSLPLLALASVAALMSGCGNLRKEPPPISYQERPVEVLYGLAASLLDAGAFQQSVLYFREVERQHPYSDWARRAMIMSAYANYRSGGDAFGEALSDADNFVRLYPGNPMAAYAYYLKAVIYYEQIVDVGRDQGNTEQAQAALREVIRRYPGSDYAADARIKLQRVDDHLAGKEMTVGRFYLRNGDTLAAVTRFRNVVDRYQTTSHAPEALYRLVEAYLTLGVVDEANRNAAVLGANFPGDPWYSDAYQLMTGRGLRPAVAPSGPRRLRNLFGLTGGNGTAEPPASPALPPPAQTPPPAPSQLPQRPS